MISEQYTLFFGFFLVFSFRVSLGFCVGEGGGSKNHGRWKRYVEIKNRTMKAGDADVGMKSNGSQLYLFLFFARFQVSSCLPPSQEKGDTKV